MGSVLLGLAFCIRLFAQEAAHTGLTQDQFTQKHLEKVLKLYREGKRPEALQELDQSFRMARAEYGDAENLHHKVWTEAQIYSGNADEEWGLDLFLYLLRSDRQEESDPNSQKKETDYLLHGNIYSKLLSIGRIAEAREVAASEQVSLATFAKLDTLNRPYEDLGPLFDFLPDARKRKFPIKYKDVHPEASSNDSLLYYPNIYAVNDIATAALEIGDWVRAAELYRWVANYAPVFSLQSTYRKEEVNRESLVAYDNLASICRWHGFPGAADAQYGEFIALVDHVGYPVDPAALASARLSQLVIRIELGTLPANAIEIAEEAAKTIDQFKYYARHHKFNVWVQVARIYYAKGNRKRAWEIINDLAAKAKEGANPHYLLTLLNPMIDFALEEGGTHPDLEGWLIRRLEFERSMGNKFDELPLYEKYAKFLKLQERLPEAAEILREAIRLAVAMNVPNRAEKDRGVLREILDSAKFRAITDSRQVDLQPVTSRSMVIPGSLAHQRFYATNPSSVQKTGSLRMVGPIAMDKWIGPGHLSVTLDPAMVVNTLERPVVIEPGASCVVDVTGQCALDKLETKFSCVWMEPNAPPSAGIWIYSSSEVVTRNSVVDAHTVRASPFYLIPIRHMIQRAGKLANKEHVDFRISASKPMRIEVYDGTGTKLICVDANGDGDFQDKGDLVYQDLNGNGHPDLAIEADETQVALTMYVEPEHSATGSSEDSNEVSVSILEDGQWHLDSVDVIK